MTNRPNWVFTLGRAVIRPALRLRFRPLVAGLGNVPTSGPVLLVSNHLHALDTILIPSFAPRKVQFLAKASLFHGAVKGWFMRSIGAVPVHRAAGSDAQAALHAGKRVLEAGGAFAVFPEGSRSRSGRLHRGRTGAAWLALESDATVIPVGLIGTDRKRLARERRRVRMQIRFGAPVPLEDLADMPRGTARRELTSRIMSAIQSLTGQEQSEAYSGDEEA